jgi:hypothetical protein
MPVRDDCEVLWILKIELGTVLSNMKVIVNESEAVDIEYSFGNTSVCAFVIPSMSVMLSVIVMFVFMAEDSFAVQE